MMNISQLRNRCVRLTRVRNAGLVGAKVQGLKNIKSLYPTELTDEDLVQPEYASLLIDGTHNGVLRGTDLLTLGERQFKQRDGSGEFTEVTPTIMDIWGWEDLQVLSEEEIRKLVQTRQSRLDRDAEMAHGKAKEYRRRFASLLQPQPEPID